MDRKDGCWYVEMPDGEIGDFEKMRRAHTSKAKDALFEILGIAKFHAKNDDEVEKLRELGKTILDFIGD